MATLNDFKVIKANSKKMFGFVETEKKIKKKLDDDTKARLGFYHLVLESVTQSSNINDIADAIIDQEYNTIVFDQCTDDLGVDAVWFSHNGIEKEVSLFNFKYRKNFADKNQEENAISRSQKFIEYCLSKKKIGKNNEKVRQKVDEIRKLIERDEPCNIKLYMVSNDNKGFAEESKEFASVLEESYGIQIVSISLDDVVEYVYGKPKEKECSFVVGAGDFLKCNRNELSTENSYVVKLSLIDVIRIMGRDDALAKKYSNEDDDCLKKSNLDVSLLYDNVRGYLGETSFNLNIQQTLKNEPENFFMFNNGLTFVTEKLDVVEQNARTKYLFSLKGIQLVNGGQTIRSIYDYLNCSDDENKIKNLRTAKILVRIFKVSGEKSDDALRSHIAEYTNSQNAIKASDLKSIDYRQIQIENYLKQSGILYLRKAGNVGELGTVYEKRVSMELLAKILYAYYGNPERVTNQKKKLFTSYYNDIFGDGLDIDLVPSIIDLFFKVQKVDTSLTEQECCYVLYIVKRLKRGAVTTKIRNAIGLLKSAEKTYKSGNDISIPRKIIQKDFKDHVDQLIK